MTVMDFHDIDDNNNKLDGIERNNIEVKRTCCIPHCKSKYYDSKQLAKTAFYPFPDKVADFITYRCWLREIRKYNTINGESFQDIGDTFICALHFKQEDFVMDVISKEKFLKKGSVPYFVENERGMVRNIESNISTLKKDPIEAQNHLRDYKLSCLRQKICHQKDCSLQKLAKQKEKQEQKLKQLLVQQEQHKKHTSLGVSQPIDLTRTESAILKKQTKDSSDKQTQLLKSESIPKHPTIEVGASKSEKDGIFPKSNWKKKKQSLQMMLDQQKKRLADIQKQELLYEAKKRKLPVDDLPETVEQGSVSLRPTNTSVISCGKCIKLEAELRKVTQDYFELKKENDILRAKLQQREQK